ncbi:unnamed protein product, partial [Effrenium voratum]
ATVDEAPVFRKAAGRLMDWLKEKTGGESIAWVADGNWDLEEMLPQQWRRSFGKSLPDIWEEFIDVRKTFLQVQPSCARLR